jgi:hypothetical protein
VASVGILIFAGTVGSAHSLPDRQVSSERHDPDNRDGVIKPKSNMDVRVQRPAPPDGEVVPLRKFQGTATGGLY